jgi:hypothetical protein
MQEFLAVEGSWVHSENESRDGLQQQRSERFYLWRREERACMGACRGTLKSVVPWDRLEFGSLEPFFYCLRTEMSLRCKQMFPGNYECFFGQLSPFETSYSPFF